MATVCEVAPDQVSSRDVGPTWGGEITRTALIALGVFLALLAVFLTVYFQWQMAIAALVALLHDIIITTGVYALVGFEVTPATVIGLLTILGYWLRHGGRFRQGQGEHPGGDRPEPVHLQRAGQPRAEPDHHPFINTSVVGAPAAAVASILFVGAFLLGAGALKDLALVLFIGTAVGAYSSIFVATPILCDIKEREPAMKALNARVLKRRATPRRGESGPGRRSRGRSPRWCRPPGEWLLRSNGRAPARIATRAHAPSPSGSRGPNAGTDRVPSVTPVFGYYAGVSVISLHRARRWLGDARFGPDVGRRRAVGAVSGEPGA